jgi:hypothetical protein
MHRRQRRALGWALAIASLATATPAQAQAEDPGKPDLDVRERTRLRPVVPASAAALRARDRLNARLGRQGVFELDPRTGTPRIVARLDGFLTGPSGADPAQVALGYVRAHRDAFGLSEADIAAFRPSGRYTDTRGITHLTWAQAWRGIDAWQNGLRASVTADGRLINVGGSPVPGLATRTAAPGLTASEALGEALGDAGRRGLAPRATPRGGADQRTTFAGGHEARLVLFTERAGDVRLAWQVTDRAGPAEVYEHLIDARGGDVLYRENQAHSLVTDADVFDYAPDRSTLGPQPITVDDATDLSGPGAFAILDTDGDGSADAPVPANNGDDWEYSFAPIGTGGGCAQGPCSWQNGVAFSWDANKEQTVTNLYHFVDVFQQWLESQVGFTNATGGFGPGDRVTAVALSSADAGGTGLPSRTDNAFALPSDDGQGSRIEFFLFNSGRDSSHDATIVFHEYVHLLSFRLVRAPDGSSGLTGYQSNAMGEAWGDW